MVGEIGVFRQIENGCLKSHSVCQGLISGLVLVHILVIPWVPEVLCLLILCRQKRSWCVSVYGKALPYDDVFTLFLFEGHCHLPVFRGYSCLFSETTPEEAWMTLGARDRTRVDCERQVPYQLAVLSASIPNLMIFIGILLLGVPWEAVFDIWKL